MNKKLSKILCIKDPAKEDIFGIVGRMEVLLDFFKSNPKHYGLVPFLQTYYLITKSVAEKRVANGKFFRDQKAMDALDTYFASLYFDPLRKFLTSGKLVNPWKRYFEYCLRPRGIPFLQMLLGINAHINTDLFTSLVHVRYANRHDFLAINRILKQNIPPIMKFLAYEEHDAFGFGALVAKKFIFTEFHDVIVGWRMDAWKNARRAGRGNFKLLHRKISAQTESMAGKLIAEFKNLYHPTRLAKALKTINGLEVRV